MDLDAWVRNWFEQVWNRGDESAIDRLLATEATAHGLQRGNTSPMRGPAAFKPFFRSFRSAFPDIHVEVQRTVTQDNLVCAHLHVTGTHHGEGLGAAPTGERIEFSGIVIARVENGQIQESWNSFDFMSMFQQVKMLPPLTAHAR
jgi:steroid delta-isomerase-like uncharacterized protein